MNRKPIKAIVSVALITSFVLSLFSGCKAEGDKNHYSVLQWLDKVENTFNLLYYTETEPLVKSMSNTDSGFDTVQIAAEWGIINPEDEIDFDGRLTKEFAADTLVRAMNCVTPATVDISDSKKVNPLYLENVMSSVNEGLFEVKSGKFQPKKKLTIAQADGALEAAHYKWVNFSYGESFDRSIVKENVINFGGVTSENCPVTEGDYKVEYSGSREFFDEFGGYTDNTQKTITFSAGKAPEGLAVDSVLAMPADDVVPMNYAVVVTGITNNSDGSVTVSTRKAELENVYEEIDIQQSGPVDFSNAIFYGPDGQRLTFSTDNGQAAPMGNINSGALTKPLGVYRPGDPELEETSDTAWVKVKLGDNLSLKLETSLEKNGGTLGFEITGKVKDGDGEMKFTLGAEEGVSVENRIHTHWEWDWLNSGIKVDELRMTVTETQSKTIGGEFSIGKEFGKEGEADDSLKKLYDSLSAADKKNSLLGKMFKSATSVKLMDVVIPETDIHLVIRAELTIEGSLKLTITQSTTAGAELVGKNLRPIYEKSQSKKLDFAAKIELTFRLSLEFQLLGANIADIGIQAGVGAKASSVVYSYDKSTDALMEVCGVVGTLVKPGETITAGDTLQIDEMGIQIPGDSDTRITRKCTEFSIYPIFNVFACSESSIAGQFFGSLELEVLGEDDSLLKWHIEEGKVVKECSATANDNFGITTGDALTLNLAEYAVDVSDEADTGLKIVTLPKKSSINDVTITSDNPDVLTVENLVNTSQGIELNVKPKLKFMIKLFGSLTQPNTKTDLDSMTINYDIGSWFYDDVSGNPKPQFALTGKKNGTANVTVTVNGESVTVPVQVGTGEEPVVSEGALVSKVGTFTLVPGETAQAEFEHIPEEKTISDVNFQSSDNSVATVTKGGRIKAVGNGDAIITATLHGEDKDYNTTFTVHVVS